MNPILLTADANSMSGLLSMATEVVTWLITTMGSYLNFITTNPIIVLGIIIMIAGLGIGMLFRIMHSA